MAGSDNGLHTRPVDERGADSGLHLYRCGCYGKAPNAEAIRLLMSSQFWYFRQLLDAHLAEADMFACLRTLLDFFNAGWEQLSQTLK